MQGLRVAPCLRPWGSFIRKCEASFQAQGWAVGISARNGCGAEVWWMVIRQSGGPCSVGSVRVLSLERVGGCELVSGCEPGLQKSLLLCPPLPSPCLPQGEREKGWWYQSIGLSSANKSCERLAPASARQREGGGGTRRPGPKFLPIVNSNVQ